MFKSCHLNILISICVLLFGASCNKPGQIEKLAGQGVSKEAAAHKTMGIDWDRLNPYGRAQVVATINDDPVTKDELERFNKRFNNIMGMGHGEDVETTQLIGTFVRFTAGVKEAQRLGMETESKFTNRFDTFLMLALAPHYRKWKVANAEIDPAKIASRIPKQWVMMNFALRIYSDLEDAKQAAKVITSQSSFLEVDKSSKIRSEIKETGLIFPDSGFFETWDDRDLFELGQGDIHGPILTGIGPALVLVKERLEMSEKQQGAFLEEIRAELAYIEAEESLSRNRQDIIVSLKESPFTNAVQREFTGMGFSDDVIATVNNMDITYRMFRMASSKSYGNVIKFKPRSNWSDIVKVDLQSFIRQLIVGMKAMEDYEKGEWPGTLSDTSYKTLYDYKKVLLYYSFLDKINAEVKENINEDDLSSFYESSKERFALPPQARIIYLFTTNEEISNIWKKVLNEGGSFTDAGNAIVQRGSMHSAGDELNISRALISKGDYSYRTIQDRIFAMREGDTAVIKGDMGQYLVQVQETQPSTIPPMNEIREVIEVYLGQMRLSSAVNKRIDEIASKLRVEFQGDFKLPKQMKDIPHPDLG